jgi:hypothetical protein
MRRMKVALAGASAAVMFAAAGCGGDNGDGSGGDAGGNGMGAGDPAASSVILGGDDLEVHVVRCVGAPGEDGSLRVHADVGDPGDNVLMAVDEQPDGARVRITRGQGDPDFSGHSWYSPSDRIGDAEIDADGARGDLELRWDTNSGQDEAEEGGPISIIFDLVCA